ncbi:8866_t:CDS:2 [Paraglomus brasilianum]|uniref:8866_t:CDS:1 n=1 Tax=Paraglomus brasilianum TaxID=144538 RepID=A0A9N9CT35_9GLOM|nr:8866_t:CDS:2 [Paraglomus brasilianum]
MAKKNNHRVCRTFQRTQGIVIPDTSKLVTRPHFRPLSIITCWDASVRSQTGLISSSNNNKAIESRMQMIPMSLQCCPNKEAISGLSTSLGQLFRVGTLACTNWTTEEPTTPCCFIQPDHIFTQNDDRVPVRQVPAGSGQDEPHGHCKNSLMVVEKIKNESDARRIAESIWYTLIKKESDVTDYLECIKKFGFDHIIIIGEHENGLLFLDCYGRVFYWDYMSALLRPLGKNLNECDDIIPLVWGSESDGTVTEFYYPE